MPFWNDRDWERTFGRQSQWSSDDDIPDHGYDYQPLPKELTMQAEVIVTIKPDGTTNIEAEGWTGPTCSTITEPYRKALGAEITNTKKPEFFQATHVETLKASH